MPLEACIGNSNGLRHTLLLPLLLPLLLLPLLLLPLLLLPLLLLLLLLSPEVPEE
jgi:hypothetical protein